MAKINTATAVVISHEMEFDMKKRLNLGDIFEIPLPSGKNAYGRLYKEGILGIYQGRYSDISELSEDISYDFFVCVYDDVLRDGVWKKVGNRKFSSKEDAWAPPLCVIDAITGIGSLYYKGEIRPCTYEECKNLEIAAVWDRHHVVDRLMGISSWQEQLGRPKK